MRPPAEFLGMARALRWRVQAADAQVEIVVDKVRSCLQDRVRRHPRRPVREGTLIDLHRFWRFAMPSYGLVGSSVSIEDRREPAFMVMRVSACRFNTDLWDGAGADGLGISLCTVRARRGAVEVEPIILGACSLHGLARRIERGSDRSDASVFEDLARLGWRYFQTLNDGNDKFTLPTSDGSWAGSLVWLDKRPAALAQTWLTEGQAARVLPPVEMTLENMVALIDGLPSMAVSA